MDDLVRLRRGELRGIRRLGLACGLSEFPSEIYDLADTLEILDLSGNALSCLPDDLPRLGKLRIIFCSDNQFTELPEVLGRCPQLEMVGFKANRIARVSNAALPAGLRWLILTDNRIETLPEGIGRCTRLQKLMLAGNRLTALPPALANCRNLELLRIAANRLNALPAWLCDLPRLAWLAFAGNPFCAEIEREALGNTALSEIHWDELKVREQLGEGASGIIHRAGHGAREVAVKLFKGAVTSDGLPASEIAACLAAGCHPGLIPALARLRGHPERIDGLLMPLIDPGFGNLAGPPSLDSCTRDVYAPEVVFATKTLLGIAHAIASAAAHLHRRGILHGDLYAHNILHAGAGEALLGDFGAASMYDARGATGAALQRIEVRAFGCLLEELVERCRELSGRHARVLGKLVADCLDERPASRPLFAEIESRLDELRLAEASGHAA